MIFYNQTHLQSRESHHVQDIEYYRIDEPTKVFVIPLPNAITHPRIIKWKG